MADINLVTKRPGQGLAYAESSVGLIVVFVILILVLALYGSLIFLNKKTTSNIGAVQNEFSSNYKNLTEGNAKEVVDFQNRLSAADTYIKQGRDARADLENIEKLIIPSVYLSGYKFNGADNSLVLNCVTDNYNSVAKQILSFKKSPDFSQVITGKTAASSGNASAGDSKNEINFDVTLILK